jgi:hypothetical protein
MQSCFHSLTICIVMVWTAGIRAVVLMFDGFGRHVVCFLTVLVTAFLLVQLQQLLQLGATKLGEFFYSRMAGTTASVSDCAACEQASWLELGSLRSE